MRNLKRRVELFIANLHHETKRDGKTVKLITIEEVADLHEMTARNARKHLKNLESMKVDGKRFFEYGQDFYLGDRDSGRVSARRGTLGSASRSKALILLTEEGYLKLAQRFSDPRAAAIQAMLVNAYFRGRELYEQSQELLSHMAEKIQGLEMDLEISRLEQKLSEARQLKALQKIRRDFIAPSAANLSKWGHHFKGEFQTLKQQYEPLPLFEDDPEKAIAQRIASLRLEAEEMRLRAKVRRA